MKDSNCNVKVDITVQKNAKRPVKNNLRKKILDWIKVIQVCQGIQSGPN